MKKVLLFAVSGLLMLSIVSCGSKKKETTADAPKKATTLAELKKTYDGKEFKNCDEALAFAEESFDVYFATIDKAIAKDEQALKDIDAFEDYFNSFDSKMEKFEGECPEKMDAMQEKLGKKFEAYMPKLMELAGMGGNMEDMEGEIEEIQEVEGNM